MPLEITVGTQKLVINQGATFLVTDPDGQVRWPTDKGLYDSDTRLVSSWRIFADGEGWDLLNSASITYYASRIYLANKPITTQNGHVPAGTLGLAIGRSIGGGLHEDIDLVNNGQAVVRFNLEIAIRSDFADLFEVKSNGIVRRGQIVTEWSPRKLRLQTTYRNQDFMRDVGISVRNADTRPVYANGRLSFDVTLEPGAKWHACLLYELSKGGVKSRPPAHCIEGTPASKFTKQLDDWRKQTLEVRTSNEGFRRFYQQAVEDMAALRLPIEGTDHLEFVPAAGVPWFVGLFGRDSLIVSLQNAILYPTFARGTLEVLGQLQATERDDYRDAEPGKILHELRTGELAHFKLIPHTPYYGSADATMLYLIVLHSAWRSTGDMALLERHMAVAERCLAWIDAYGDRDGDGFQEYQTRSTAGYENQGWKDSGEALVYPDGTLVKGPKALCELQGYVYDAWLRMAEIYDVLGKPDRAEELRAKAAQLFERFNEVFWDEASGFYAFALDGDKTPVLSVASNPGHLLFSGIVPVERAGRVVERLMQPDMWSGWGIRTLSAKHPAYNPHSYQNGSVWPHDNAFIALGFRRYGFAKEAALIAKDVIGAASFFMQTQLPELYSGLQREPTNFPVQYLGANIPQAWASGSCFFLLQVMLGFLADVPNGRLFIDPALPDWLPDLTVANLRLGDQRFELSFWRDGEETRYRVVKGNPAAVIRRSFASGPGLPERSGQFGPGAHLG